MAPRRGELLRSRMAHRSATGTPSAPSWLSRRALRGCRGPRERSSPYIVMAYIVMAYVVMARGSVPLTRCAGHRALLPARPPERLAARDPQLGAVVDRPRRLDELARRRVQAPAGRHELQLLRRLLEQDIDGRRQRHSGPGVRFRSLAIPPEENEARLYSYGSILSWPE